VRWEFALRPLEEACISRFETLRPHGSTPVIRSDNRPIFQSRRCRRVRRDYRLRQAFKTPSTPEQNGLIECCFRSLKEECAWQANFPTVRRRSQPWGVDRVVQHLSSPAGSRLPGYLSPSEYRAQQLNQVAC
jgi:transposase InsO family protein